MPIPVYLGGYTGSGTGAVNLNWPTHQTGDLAVLVAEYDATESITTPSGWTDMPGTPLVSQNAIGSATLHIMYRWAESASEPAVTVPDPGDHVVAVLFAYRDVNTTTPFGAFATSPQSLSASGVLPAISPTGNQSLVITGHAGSGYTQSNAPVNTHFTSLTDRADIRTASGNDGAVLFTECALPLNADGTTSGDNTGTTSVVYTNASQEIVGFSLELNGTPFVATGIGGPDTANAIFEPLTALGVASHASQANALLRTYTFGTAAVSANVANAVTISKTAYLTTPPADGSAANAFTRIPGPPTAEDISVANAITAAADMRITEVVNLSPTAAVPIMGVYTPVEALELAPALLSVGTFNIQTSEAAGLAPSVRASWVEALTSGASLGGNVVGTVAVRVAEALGLSWTAPVQAKYNTVQGENLALADTLGNFLGGAITDTLNLAPGIAVNRLLHPVETESLSLSASPTVTLVFRVIAAEALEMSDTTLLNAIYAGTLTDEVQLSLGTLSNTGDFTTWAVNTATNAVTEYSGYSFTSYATLEGRYVASSPTGLYTLEAEDDDGADIISTLRSGYNQFAGSRLATLDAAYIGMRGDGTVYLRVITADGRQHEYCATASDMKTTRVPLGRGLKARYIAFELESAGQDFDLESIEFEPLDLTRRA